MSRLPEKLYRGVGISSPHHLEVLQFGTVSPRGGEFGGASPKDHTAGATQDSPFTSWTEKESVAIHYARSKIGGKGIVLVIEFASQVAITHHYIYQGEIMGEAEYLIEGKISRVKLGRRIE
jgi:hypothetical protein